MTTIDKTDRQATIDTTFAGLTTGRTVADLTGTEKQTAWAADIRARAIVAFQITYGSVVDPDSDWGDVCPGILSDAAPDASIRMLLRIHNADWWITHRYDSSRALHTIATGFIDRAKAAKAAR